MEKLEFTELTKRDIDDHDLEVSVITFGPLGRANNPLVLNMIDRFERTFGETND